MSEEELRVERLKLFAVFTAGWTSRAKHGGQTNHEDLVRSFNAWLQAQVDEADVLGRAVE
jgi:hypothetical protein